MRVDRAIDKGQQATGTRLCLCVGRRRRGVAHVDCWCLALLHGCVVRVLRLAVGGGVVCARAWIRAHAPSGHEYTHKVVMSITVAMATKKIAHETAQHKPCACVCLAAHTSSP